MRLNSVLKACSRAWASLEVEPERVQPAGAAESPPVAEAGVRGRGVLPPERLRGDGDTAGKSTSQGGGIGLSRLEVMERSGKAAFRTASKSGRRHG